MSSASEFIILLWPLHAMDWDANTRLNESMRLLNKLRPGSIPRVHSHEDGILRRSNMSKFLASCSAIGLPPEDLFLPDDVVEGTSHSLARVVRTIIALIEWSEGSAPTNSHSLPDGDNVNPEQLPPFPPLRLRSRPERPRVTVSTEVPPPSPLFVGSTRIAARELPPPRPPRSPRRPPTLSLPQNTADAADRPPTRSLGGAITHSTRDRPISPSIKNQSTSPSIKNQSIFPPTRKRSTNELSATNEFTVPSTKNGSASNKDIYPSIMDRSTTSQPLTNQSGVSPGSMLSHRTNNESRMSLPVSILSRWTSTQFIDPLS